MEGDPAGSSAALPFAHFNPLPPHGGRLLDNFSAADANHFNPLPPHGGRQTGWSFLFSPPGNFNPLPPHGGRPSRPTYPHTRIQFQSTPSAWRETYSAIDLLSGVDISIHSLRMEGDLLTAQCCRNPEHFNPLPPHGGRHNRQRGTKKMKIFQSTPSAWRETHCTASQIAHKEFQSTPSAWRETTEMAELREYIAHISIHSLRMEGDHKRHMWKRWSCCISIHSLRMEGDLR